MDNLVVQVNMGTKDLPEWRSINRYGFDPRADRRIWSVNAYIECLESAKMIGRVAIGAWSMYHRYFGRQFRLVHELPNKSIARIVLLSYAGE